MNINIDNFFMEITNYSNSNQNPNDEIVNVLLTDCYQLMMIYAHWKNGRHNIRAVFDLYFRKSPFDLQVYFLLLVVLCYGRYR